MRARGAAALFVLTALMGCATKPAMRISSDHSPTANWSAYHTYAWRTVSAVPGRAPRGQADLLDWRIRNDVDGQLAVKGYTQIRSGRPDFWIDYHLDQKEKTTDTIGDYVRYRQGGGKEGPSEAYVFGYQEASLILEIVDARTQLLVWRASASAVASSDRSGDKVKEAVDAMLQRFPPR
jgi:hypothetical protein